MHSKLTHEAVCNTINAITGPESALDTLNVLLSTVCVRSAAQASAKRKIRASVLALAN